MLDPQATKAQLQRRLVDLLQRHGKIEAHIIHLDETLPSDLMEQLPEAGISEVIDRLDESTRAEIGAVRRAIRRIDEGSWTTCESCGDEIAPARLSALPTATRCLDCAD